MLNLNGNDHLLAIRCRDIAGRRRRTFVAINDAGRVVVIVPPGEVAEFTLDEARQFRSALRMTVISADPNLAPRAADRGHLLPCHDAVGRERAAELTPYATGRVLFRAPAAGTAVFQPLQVGALRGALRAAIDEAGQHVEAPIPTSTADVPQAVAV